MDQKSNKYDRQLRLWGDHGQSALELAKICLVNATGTGTEILKNLILPGVGSFTIVDSQKVCGEDVGSNFFLDRNNIGQSRAQVATEYLLELNEDVCGDYIEDTIDNLLEKCATFFNSYNLVIATNVPERLLLKLAAVLWENDIPLIVCRCYGFIGYVRIVVKEHTVVESHPDSAHEDLRLDQPFAGLVQFCNSLDMTAMNKKDHSHVPWLVIVYKWLTIWKDQHDGEAPQTYTAKGEFKRSILDGRLSKDDGTKEEEENFDEAVQHVNTALLSTKIPEQLKNIFDDESCNNLHAESKPFWILARAVKEFVNKEGNGTLPLRGTIPDMTADSERFIQLQTVYREKANQDIGVVSTHVLNLLQSLGRDEPLSLQKTRSPASSPASKLQNHITDDSIRLFCKNAAFLQVVRCRSLAVEYDPSTAKSLPCAVESDDQDSNDMLYYILLRAVDRFFMEHNRYPGGYSDDIELDISLLKAQVLKLLQEWSLPMTIRDEYLHEMCHFGASELPSVAAFLGGVVAQEAVKIVTEQFVPINNTFIYNGKQHTSVTVEL